MAATALFTKFDSRAFRRNAEREGAPAKPAKAAKVQVEHNPSLATLATLAGDTAEIQNADPAAWTDAHDERAAIIEHDGGVPHAWAEALARLDPSMPPAGVPGENWIKFIDACGRFLDAGWHLQANALGWGPLELFGCDRSNPPTKVEAKGLLWQIGDGDVVALTAHGALVDMGAGDLYFARRPLIPAQVLTWELAAASSAPL